MQGTVSKINCETN